MESVTCVIDLGLDDFRAAAGRLAGRVRRTPLFDPAPLALGGAAALRFKLENLQVTGSFKARGAANTVASLTDAERARGLVTASGGNHGLGVAAAGASFGAPVTIYLPTSTPPAKVRKFERWGAAVHVVGQVWDEANEAALAHAARDGLTYVHPFADPRVVAGQGTIALEMLDDDPDLDLLIVAIGGGGLISGIARAASLVKPGITVIGVEPVGAATLHDSVRAGELVTLDRIGTRAGSLAPRRSEQLNLDIIRAHVARIALVDDAAMERAAALAWTECGLALEIAAAAGLAALADGLVPEAKGARVGLIVCGAGTEGVA